MTSVDSLHQQAARVRDYLTNRGHCREFVPLNHFPRKCCKLASRLLARWLIEGEEIRDVHIVEAQRGSIGLTECHENHVWLERGHTIIDITADQFPDYNGPAVFVSDDVSWHTQFDLNRHSAPAAKALVSADSFEAEEYIRMSSSLRNVPS